MGGRRRQGKRAVPLCADGAGKGKAGAKESRRSHGIAGSDHCLSGKSGRRKTA